MRLLDPALTNFDELVSRFQWSVPARFNIAEAVCDRHADKAAPALYYANEAGAAATFTFADIQSRANQLANLLVSLGLQQQDRIAIVLPQRPETAISHVAAHKIGAVSLPLSVLFGVEALQHRLSDSEAKIAIASAEHAERLLQIREQLPALETILVCSDRSAGLCTTEADLFDDGSDENYCIDLHSRMQDFDNNFKTRDTGADEPACLIYTSGTTGPPKGALIAHRNLIGNLPGFELSLDFFPKENDVFYTPADWAWTGGLFDGLLPTWFYGMPIVGFESRKFKPADCYRLLEQYAVTCGFFPPTALKMMRTLPDAGKKYDLQLRTIMSAGEMVGEELLSWASTEFGVAINEMYGQTEQNYLVGNCSSIMKPKPGSMGKPYPGHRVEVMGPDGKLCAANETGELVAHRDDAVHFLGYWKQIEATQKKYTGDWFHTGDVGYRDDEGYLWFVGRADDVISSAGYRIGPGEIEDCILKHPAVLQVAAIGVPDPEGIRGDIVKAFVVLRPEISACDDLAADIQDTVRHQLAAYEYPRQLEFVAELPMTTTGKVRRIELRQREIDRHLA